MAALRPVSGFVTGGTKLAQHQRRCRPIVHFRESSNESSTNVSSTNSSNKLGRNVIDAVIDSHRQVERMYDEFKKPDVAQARKEELAHHIIRELSIHAEQEEMVLYPEVRKKLGDEMANQAIDEHLELKKLLCDLDAMKITDPSYEAQVDRVMQAVLHHVKDDEEPILLPKFASAEGVDDVYLTDLGDKFEKYRNIATTRPHRLAPTEPPLNIAANVLTVPLDAARDVARFGTPKPEDPLESSK